MHCKPQRVHLRACCLVISLKVDHRHVAFMDGRTKEARKRYPDGLFGKQVQRQQVRECYTTPEMVFAEQEEGC